MCAGRQDEVAINRIVQHNGYRIESTHAQDTIGAVDALRFAYTKGPTTLDTTLHTLRDTWGGDPAAVASALLKGYSTFICEFAAEIDFARLRACIVKKYTSPGNFANEAKGIKETLRIPTTAAVVHLLLTNYNRQSKKPLKRKGT